MNEENCRLIIEEFARLFSDLVSHQQKQLSFFILKNAFFYHYLEAATILSNSDHKFSGVQHQDVIFYP